jgi:hypothetical protein
MCHVPESHRFQALQADHIPDHTLVNQAFQFPRESRVAEHVTDA